MGAGWFIKYKLLSSAVAQNHSRKTLRQSENSASILKLPKYFLLARPLILTQKQIINGYFRSKSFILLY